MPYMLQSTAEGDISATSSPTVSQLHIHNKTGTTHWNYDGSGKNYIRGVRTYVDTPTTFTQPIKFIEPVTVQGRDVHADFMTIAGRLDALEGRASAVEGKTVKFTNCTSKIGVKVRMNGDWSHNSDLGTRMKHAPFKCPDDKVVQHVGLEWGGNKMWWKGKCCNVELS